MSESKNGEKKVKINDDRGNVVEVSEKHGPLFNAIPKMHLCGAAILCLLNIAIPGLGEQNWVYFSSKITNIYFYHFRNFFFSHGKIRYFGNATINVSQPPISDLTCRAKTDPPPRTDCTSLDAAYASALVISRLWYNLTY